MGVVAGVRRQAAAVLGAYGRAVVGVAEVLAGSGGQRPVEELPAPPAPVAGAQADLRTLRAAALQSTLAAAVDPSRSAAERFAGRVTGVSEWTAGRLLADTERVRVAAVELARSSTGPDGRVPLRTFAVALRRQFPWLDDDTAYALWDHAVLIGHRTPVSPVAAVEELPRGVLGGLFGRLRRNG